MGGPDELRQDEGVRSGRSRLQEPVLGAGLEQEVPVQTRLIPNPILGASARKDDIYYYLFVF